MKRTTITYLLLAAVLTAGIALSSSCTKEVRGSGVTPGGNRATGRPIAFCVNNSTPATRGLDPLDNDRLLNFRVWAGYAQSVFGEDSRVDDWIAGDKVSKQDDGSFSAENVYYWPIMGTLTFFACAPASAVTAAAAPGTGSFCAPFAPEQTNVTNQVDFCVATPVVNATKDGGTVNFNFSHTLCYVTFAARYTDTDGILARTGFKVKVDEIQLMGVKGSRDIVVLPQASDFFSWEDNADSATPATYSLSRSAARQHLADVALTESYSDITYLNGRLYLLPQELTDAAKLGVTFSLNNDTRTVSQFYFEKALPASPAWTAASKIKYNLTIDLSGMKDIEIQATSGQWLDDWEDAGNTPADKTIE